LNRVIFSLLTPQPPSLSGSPHSGRFYITLSDPPLSVGRLWTSDQLVAETTTWKNTTLKTD